MYNWLQMGGGELAEGQKETTRKVTTTEDHDKEESSEYHYRGGGGPIQVINLSMMPVTTRALHPPSVHHVHNADSPDYATFARQIRDSDLFTCNS